MVAYLGSDVYVSRPLTNLALAYENPEFIGNRLVPPIPVDAVAGSYYVRSKDPRQRVRDLHIGALDAPPEIDADLEERKYAVEDFAVSTRLPVKTNVIANLPWNLRQDMTLRVQDALDLQAEVRIAALLSNPANYGNNTLALGAAVRFDDAVDPLGVILDARSALRRSSNTRIIAFGGLKVYNALRLNTALRSTINPGGSPTMPAMLQKQALASLFEVDEFMVGESYRTDGLPGLASTESRIWGNVFGMIAVANSPSTQSLHFASRFEFLKAQITEMYEPLPGLMGVYVTKGAKSDSVQVIDPAAGFLITTAVG